MCSRDLSRRTKSSNNLRIDVERARSGSNGSESDISISSVTNAKSNNSALEQVRITGPQLCTDCNENDAQKEGRVLFQHFIYDEIEKEGLNFPNETDGEGSFTNDEYIDPVWAKTGEELREIAKWFSRTEGRVWVRTRATELSNFYVGREQFEFLLDELFSSSGPENEIVSFYERVVALFFFCSDLLITALRANLDSTFKDFVQWSTCFICSRVTSWVELRGGWDQVLHVSFNKKSTMLVAVLFLISVGVFIYKGNKSPFSSFL